MTNSTTINEASATTASRDAPSAMPPTSVEAFEAVRPQVRDLLLKIPSFLSIPEEEKAQIARDTVRVLSYMTDPNGLTAELTGTTPAEGADTIAETVSPVASQALSAAPPPTAEALKESAVDQTKRNLSGSPGFAGKDFQAGAVEQGVEQFGEMVQKVDFPKFVGGLIENVFQAIVESSIEQMRAYGELIANVAKTTDQFMADNIGQSAGRDYLADKYPDVISIGGGGSDDFASGFAEDDAPAGPVMQATGDNAAVRLAEISKEMNINPPITDLSDANAEMRLMTAARLEMAKSRQQLLSSMVMLGINRIVVTDGSINAKVVFSMRASDTAKRQYRASMHDKQSMKNESEVKARYGGWYSPVAASVKNKNTYEHVTTVGTSVDETSESKAEVKAKLSGNVRLNFKSDYLPMEKMATPEMMSVIQGNSTPYNPNTPKSGGQAGA
ncbi:hypothetical protein [Parasphingorhabdus sp.]|uniref:hypothetical protein n=1 Tax=Parasphingorhabdus sp. TaxID=2709688 RepID=UPI002B26C960|nr:hypothetical protein [Parasphingorhabdus sp.]